jgi:hypothetical protein
MAGAPDGEPTESRGDDALVEVVFLDLPVEEYRRSQQHHAALLREFALIDADEEHSRDEVPTRVTALVHELGTRFGRFSVEPEERLRRAVAEGAQRIDITFRVPPSARQASLDLRTMLDEADEWCRRGALMTLATPDDVVAFRSRYLDEFVHQLDGGRPRPFDE